MKHSYLSMAKATPDFNKSFQQPPEVFFKKSHLFSYTDVEVFSKQSVLKDFTKFTRKHLCKSLFSNKVVDEGLQLYLKNRLWHKCFPVNFYEIFKNALFTEHLCICTSQKMTLTMFKSFIG